LASNKGRARGDWSGSYEGWLLRGIIQIYYNRGDRQEVLTEHVHKHASRELIAEITGRDMNANSINERGNKGKLAVNAFEHPDKHPMGMKMMPFARKVVEENIKLDRAMMHAMVEEALATEQSVTLSETTVDEKGVQAGLIYVESTGSDNCCFGMTTKLDAEERVKNFRKGDIDRRMHTRHVLWLKDAKKIDTLMKQYFKPDHEGAERYSVPADTVWHRLRKIANAERVAHYVVMENGADIGRAV
jgi:hypothetical protein